MKTWCSRIVIMGAVMVAAIHSPNLYASCFSPPPYPKCDAAKPAYTACENATYTDEDNKNCGYSPTKDACYKQADLLCSGNDPAGLGVSQTIIVPKCGGFPEIPKVSPCPEALNIWNACSVQNGVCYSMAVPLLNSDKNSWQTAVGICQHQLYTCEADAQKLCSCSVVQPTIQTAPQSPFKYYWK